MEQNLKLLSGIRKKGLRQVDFARLVGDHHTFISRVVNGWINLDEGRKQKYADALGMKVSELFE
jgi:hypothetical protein